MEGGAWREKTDWVRPPSTLHPPPSTRNPQPATRNPQPSKAMANRSNHYEAAFEGFIRSFARPVRGDRRDPGARNIFGEDGLKNPDFLLYPLLQLPNLVVEVKGKRGKDSRGCPAAGRTG